jgi:CheY-like chemotaxis protein
VEDGVHLLRQARELNARLPFILLTGSEMPDLDQTALAAGASDYLVKGQITPAMLDRSIRYAIKHRQAEEELLENRRRLELALDSAQMGAWELDLVTNTSMRSLRHDQIFGYDSLQPKWDFDIFMRHVVTEDYGRVKQAFEQAFSTGEFSMQCRIAWPDDSLHWIESKGRVYRNAEGKPAKMLGIVSDITGRKADEKALEEAKEIAEQSLRARSAFLANMSHEIRTPMNGVIGMTSLLLETPMSPEQQEYVETIRGSGETLLVLISDILDFSKIESGSLELEQQEFDLISCVEESLMLFKAEAHEAKIELMYRIDRDVPHLVTGDVTRLRQILSNLGSNAVKFTAGGEVEVAVKLLSQPGDDPTTCMLAFSVRDTGIGIPKDKQDRLFLNFSQVDSSTTRRFGGTGLGLAISKRLVEIMGGTIEVESQEGVGSTFRFTTRVGNVATGETRETSIPASRGASVAGRRILVVDDNATNRRILQLYVEGWGAKVREAEGAAEALRVVLSEKSFDACLLDFHMPECDGLMLAGKLRAQHTPGNVPIIFLTSGSKESIRSAAQGLGITQIIDKPVRPHVLHDALLKSFDRTGVLGVESAAPPPSIVEIARDHPISIIVAEDNSVNQLVARRMLLKLGYRVDVAGNGSEVVDAFTSRNYDVVFMDIHMPVMDGLEATRKLRARTGMPQPWIIAMTATAMVGDRERFLSEGIDDYVSKPVKLSDLSDALLRAWAHGKGKGA